MEGGGPPSKKNGARGNRFSKHETAPPMDSDVESELGGADLVSESGEEGTPQSGERRTRARRVRVARRWLDPHRNLENDWKK